MVHFSSHLSRQILSLFGSKNELGTKELVQPKFKDELEFDITRPLIIPHLNF